MEDFKNARVAWWGAPATFVYLKDGIGSTPDAAPKNVSNLPPWYIRACIHEFVDDNFSCFLEGLSEPRDYQPSTNGIRWITYEKYYPKHELLYRIDFYVQESVDTQKMLLYFNQECGTVLTARFTPWACVRRGKKVTIADKVYTHFTSRSDERVLHASTQETDYFLGNVMPAFDVLLDSILCGTVIQRGIAEPYSFYKVPAHYGRLEEIQPTGWRLVESKYIESKSHLGIDYNLFNPTPKRREAVLESAAAFTAFLKKPEVRKKMRIASEKLSLALDAEDDFNNPHHGKRKNIESEILDAYAMAQETAETLRRQLPENARQLAELLI